MRDPIAIEPGDETHAFGVIVPDLLGCYSAGDTLEEVHANAKESAELWLEAVLEDGGAVPHPSSPEALRREHPEWADWIWSSVEVDVPDKSDRGDRRA